MLGLTTRIRIGASDERRLPASEPWPGAMPLAEHAASSADGNEITEKRDAGGDRAERVDLRGR